MYLHNKTSDQDFGQMESTFKSRISRFITFIDIIFYSCCMPCDLIYIAAEAKAYKASFSFKQAP